VRQKIKIILSGASSFLGSKFLELYQKKYNIITFSKNDPSNSIDLLDYQKIKNLFKKIQPQVVIHFAATSDRNDPNINETNFIGTKNVLEQAKELNIPFIFMSSESVYGGNLPNEKEILEDREYDPKTDYAKSKVKSEKLIIQSNLPYLILRGHRFIGFVKNYSKPKQFPDTIKSILNNDTINLDSRKQFRPSFINHICEVIDFYITNQLGKKRILNSVIEKNITYYDLIIDICDLLGLDTKNINDNGNEISWEEKSILSIQKLKTLKYPCFNYDKMIKTLKEDF